MKLALCGKGGSGKSTIAVLLARAFLSEGYHVLVVDSDESNSGLYRKLGFTHAPLPIMDIVGGRQGIKDKKKEKYAIGGSNMDTGIIDQNVLKIADIPDENIVKNNGLALVQIGKINQALEGCACPMGLLNREFLHKLSLSSDEVIIIDTEAGLEHFGRGIESGIDSILIIVDPSSESVEFAEKAFKLSKSMNVANIWIVINRAGSDSVVQKMTGKLKEKNIKVDLSVLNDTSIFDAELDGKPVISNKAQVAVNKLVHKLLTKRNGE